MWWHVFGLCDVIQMHSLSFDVISDAFNLSIEITWLYVYIRILHIKCWWVGGFLRSALWVFLTLPLKILNNSVVGKNFLPTRKPKFSLTLSHKWRVKNTNGHDPNAGKKKCPISVWIICAFPSLFPDELRRVSRMRIVLIYIYIYLCVYIYVYNCTIDFLLGSNVPVFRKGLARGSKEK